MKIAEVDGGSILIQRITNWEVYYSYWVWRASKGSTHSRKVRVMFSIGVSNCFEYL